MSEIGALILAAGKGTRMCSQRPKVLHELLGEPMLWYVYKALEEVHQGPVWTVIGHEASQVEKAFAGQGRDFILQEQQLGTGHALQCAWQATEAVTITHLLVINGDTPLIDPESLTALATQCQQDNVQIGFLTTVLDDPGAFGRVVRDQGGQVAAIVEAKDFSVQSHGPATGEINAGIYCLEVLAIGPLLGRLGNDNASGEFYITDLVDLAVQNGLNVCGVQAAAGPELLGINSPLELSHAEEILRQRIVRHWQTQGVSIHFAQHAVIGPQVELEPGASLTAPVELYGKTRIAAETQVASHTWIKDSVVGKGTEVRPFSHLEEATVGQNCLIGPYARLRPGATVEQDARVGNFVEMKKAVLRKGAKASHLTYLGDADVGERANIGAGTITCNYDGVNKHHTAIGKDAFIGSNTALVAPVTIGAGALIGAGSVITKDVEDDYLAVTRAKQRTIPRKK